MFTKAIVKTPGKSFVNGITSANLGLPNYDLALKQHKAYVDVLISCGLDVKVLPPDENFPDSTFVEDTALLTPPCAIITNPGAPPRKGEVIKMKKVLEEFYSDIEEIKEPGTVEAGDIMMVGNHYYIGLSKRTNLEGANQLIRILNKYDMSASVIELKNVLHLKTGVAYLEHNNLAACGEFVTHPDFEKFNIIEIPQEESYAANCIWINDKVLIPKGYPKSKKKILDAGLSRNMRGYSLIEVDVSEFRKLDGGLSCLSLRF